MRQNLREAGPIPSDSLCRVPEGKLLPDVVVGLLAVHIGEVLLATGTGLWTDRLLRKHGIILVASPSTLSIEQVHDLTDLLSQLGKSLHHILLVGELS